MLADLIYPDLCFACKKNISDVNSSVCIHCQYNITPTNYHKMKDNPVSDRFWGRIKLEHASTSFVFSKGGLLQKLIHSLKYENKPDIGVELGKMYGILLVNTPPYNSVDFIIPVPLHPKKEHFRGYNQATMFAKGLSETMNIPWSESFLIRTENTETQTKKSRTDRFANVQSAFKVALPDKIKDKHLLLVDDVITTGATLEACAVKLLDVEGVKVSLSAIALSG
jgi:ComF family protein